MKPIREGGKLKTMKFRLHSVFAKSRESYHNISSLSNSLLWSN